MRKVLRNEAAQLSRQHFDVSMSNLERGAQTKNNTEALVGRIDNPKLFLELAIASMKVSDAYHALSAAQFELSQKWGDLRDVLPK